MMTLQTVMRSTVAAILVGQRFMARDVDRQVAEVQVRIAVMNGYTAHGIPVTDAVG